MPLNVGDFKDGDTATVGQAIDLYMKLDKDAGEEGFIFVCSTENEESFNEEMSSYATLCSEGNMNNAPAGQDYEIPFVLKWIKGDLSNDLYDNKHNQMKRYDVPIRLDHKLFDARTEFLGFVSLDSSGGSAEDQGELSGTIKISKGTPTVTKITDGSAK